MEIRRYPTVLVATALTALGGLAYNSHGFDSTSVAQAQTMEAPATPPDQDQIDFCVNEAMGAADNADFATMNPARAVSAGYVGKRLVRFFAGVEANAVSPDCAGIVTGRRYSIDQIYKGKVNTPSPIIFEGLGKMTGDQHATVRLMVPFSGIRGRKVRAWRLNVTETIATADGLITKTGSRTVRPKTDGI